MTQAIQKPDFWQHQKEAVRVTQELSDLQQELSNFENVKTEEDLKKMEFRVFLSGKYDKGTALLSIMSGAGGQDAQDWATILLRMYQRYADRQGFKTKILDQSFGEGVVEGRSGIKSVTLEIAGKYAYGYLKKESGVHRLVRISPFSAQSLRHTSFALVEVLPEISLTEGESMEVKPEQLSVEVCKASGPGGQNVNKRMTAVRVIHLPTGLTVECHTERNLQQNKESAIGLLAAKILEKQEMEQLGALDEKRRAQIGWAKRAEKVRTYNFPQDRLTDHRVKKSFHNLEGIMDGKLDKLVETLNQSL